VSDVDAPVPAPAGLAGAVRRYQVMANIVGTLLIVLFFVAVPLTWAHHPELGRILGPLHGILYIVYLVTTLDLFRRTRFHLGWLLLMVCAGFVPFLAFIIEYIVVRQIHRRYRFDRPAAGARPAGPPA
jgi:integral membrane protein